jgi:hypothetical protein
VNNRRTRDRVATATARVTRRRYVMSRRAALRHQTYPPMIAAAEGRHDA